MNRILMLLICLMAIRENTKAQIPALSSDPSSAYVIYMDFGGSVINNPNWADSTIHAAAANLTPAQITEVFNRVAEKYRPFDVNITTDPNVYLAAAASNKVHQVITPTSAWYGPVGGVTYVGSFGYTVFDPSWVFTDNLSNDPEYIADAAAHEAGHTLGLVHHGQFSPGCVKLNDYNQGQGTGQTSWGPCMGAPYGMNRVVWYKGATTTTDCDQADEDDLYYITSGNGFGYKVDDIGNTIATAKTLGMNGTAINDSGIIAPYTDIDMFKFVLSSASVVTINVNPYSVGANNEGAVLDVKTRILDVNGNQLYIDTPSTILNTTQTIPGLSAGTYYIEVSANGNSNYNAYGGTQPTLAYSSMGKYYITGSFSTATSGIPAASFTASATTACVGQTITFTDNSSNDPTSWSWQSVGATIPTVTTQDATFSFPAAGTYTVSLVASNSFGSSSATKQITINALPSSNIAGGNSICSGNSVTLTASGGASYTWAPSTGLNQTTGISVTATPSSSITYTLTATGSNGCVSSIPAAITVNPIPVINSSANVSLCTGLNTTLTASGANTYTWSPSTGLNLTTGASVIATPLLTTVYTVTGSNGLCSASKTVTVTISPALNITLNTTSANICNGSNVALSAAGATTYTWSPSTGLNLTTGSTITASPVTNTTYTVTGTSSTCTGTQQVIVSVTPLPVLTVTANSAICAGSSVSLSAGGATTYVWSPSTGLNTSTGASVTATPASTSTYSVTGTTNGCSKTGNVVVTVNPLPALLLGSNATICAGSSVSLSASGATTYAWSPSTGLNSTSGATVTAAPASSSTYNVTGTSNGCSKTGTIAVTVNPLPVLALGSNVTVCSGSSASLSAGGATTYTWSPSTGLNTTTGATVTATPSSTSTYSITGTTNACSATGTIIVTVNPLPALTVGSNAAICSGSSVSISASGASSYAWTPASGLNNSTSASVTASPAATTVYTVIGTSNGCSKYGSVTVTVNPLPSVSVVTTGNALCAGATSTLTASGASTYTWSPSTGLNLTTGATVTASPTANTTYTLTGTLNGCTKTSSTIINVSPSFTLQSTANSSICNGASVTLSGTGATSYTWSPSAGLNQTTGSSVTSTPAASVTYTVTGTTGYCSKSNAIIITDNPRPQLSSVITPAGCGGAATGAVTLTVSGVSSSTYLWSDGAKTQNISSLAPGNYSVTVTSGQSCTSSLANSVTAASCPLPVNVTSLDVTLNSATIHWSPSGCAASYAIRYAVSGTSTWTEGTAISADSIFNITGLAENTTYEFEVQSYCNTQKTDSSAYSTAQTFTTGEACVTPTGYVTSGMTSTEATLGWAAVPGVWGYNVRYSPSSGSTHWTDYSVQAPATSYTITGLSAGTNYKWQVWSQCNSSGTSVSPLSTTIYFATFGSGRVEVMGDGASAFAIETYPNPTSGQLHLTIEAGGNQHIQVQIINLLGEQIINETVETSQDVTDKLFDISAFPSGMYLVRATDGENIWVEKVIKQ